MIKKFTVIGKPVAKARARTLRSGITYTPEKTVNYSNCVKWAFVESLKGEPWTLIDIPVFLTIDAYFQVPKSKVKKGVFTRTKTTKPDVDNVAKAIMDSLNKIAWTDDSVVCALLIKKIYTANQPRCEIVIEWDSEQSTHSV